MNKRRYSHVSCISSLLCLFLYFNFEVAKARQNICSACIVPSHPVLFPESNVYIKKTPGSGNLSINPMKVWITRMAGDGGKGWLCFYCWDLPRWWWCERRKNKSPGTAGAFIQYLDGAFICLPPAVQRLFCAVWKQSIQEKGMKEGI